MNEDSFDQQEAARSARNRLTQACRTKDTSLRLAWAITTGEGILLGFLAVALADYWLMLPVWMRLSAAGVLSALAGLGAWRLVRYYRRPTALKEAALDVETARPELGCEISTAAEYLSGERQSTHEYEPELVAALEARAAEELRKVTVPYERRLVRPAVLFGVTLVVLVLFALAAPVAFTAFQRAALPFSKAHYTQVTVEPGNFDVPVGSNVEITNMFSGRLPKNPAIHWLFAGDTSWRSAPLTAKTGESTFVHSFENVRSKLTYRVTGNDAASPDFVGTTYVPPEVKDLEVRIEYPSYTHLAQVTQKAPDIEAVRASSVQIRVDPSVQLSAAKLRFSNPPEEVKLTPAEAGTWMATLKVTKDTDYWIELADERGHRGGDDKPHHIKVLPDLPPRVEIEDPGQDMRASATNRLPVKVSVADDFGVEQVELIFNKLGGPEQRVTVKSARNERGELIADAELDLAALGVSEYELVAYHARAKDNNTLDGPGVGNSPVYFVEVTNLEGKPCKCKQPGQKVNLLVIQKQIIADTAALAPNAEAEKYQSLAKRQRDAADFGQVYFETLKGSGAPAAALDDMQAAVNEMQGAEGELSREKRSEALPPEELALAHLYQVLKNLPELEDLPTQPKQDKKPPSEKLAVVLEAIKQKKKEQAEENNVADALAQAQELVRSQAEVNTALRKTQSAGQGQGQEQARGQAQGQGKGQGKGQGEGKGQGQGDGRNAKSAQDLKPDPTPAEDKLNQEDLAKADAGQGKAEPQPDRPTQQPNGEEGKSNGAGQGQDGTQLASQNQAQAHGQGQGQAGGQGKGKGPGEGQGKGERQGQPAREQAPEAEALAAQEPQSEPAQLAEREKELSQQAADLAEKLQRLAGNDKRLGHNAGQQARSAGQKIANAGQEIRRGNFGAAGVNGYQGEQALRQVVTQLERVVRTQPELTDVAAEDAPPRYEGLISEYFKKLSHAE